MKAVHIVLLTLFAVGMGAGQLLLKYSASRQAQYASETLFARLCALAMDWPFVVGAVSYGFLLIYWVWLLTFLPLSRAYPFTLLSVAVATAGSALFFHEPLTPRFIAGLLVIAIGFLLLGLE